MRRTTRLHEVRALSRGRRAFLNLLDVAAPRHCMYGLLEVDVTEARRRIADHRGRTGETLSFTAFVVSCLARTIDEDRVVQGYLRRRKHLFLFEDVDVSLMVERKVGENAALSGHILRGANRRSFRELHDELRAAQAAPVPEGRGIPGWLRSALLLPWPLSAWVKSLLRALAAQFPERFTAVAGTVGVSAVGMFGGARSGWGLYAPTYSLELLIGSTAWKPAVVDGKVTPREFVDLTLVFDHDVVDGAPAARFARRFVERLERAEGLEVAPQPRPAEGAAADVHVTH